MSTSRNRAGRIALVGMMAALAICLSFLESLLPQMPFLPPGAKLGLSNLVVLYAATALSVRGTLAIAVLKSGFVLLMRGVTAGALSLSGGLLSALVMCLLCRTRRISFSYLFISVCGALCHNLAQLAAASGLIGGDAARSYLPFVLLAGAGMGAVNGVVIRAVMPALGNLGDPSSGRSEV